MVIQVHCNAFEFTHKTPMKYFAFSHKDNVIICFLFSQEYFELTSKTFALSYR